MSYELCTIFLIALFSLNAFAEVIELTLGQRKEFKDGAKLSFHRRNGESYGYKVISIEREGVGIPLILNVEFNISNVFDKQSWKNAVSGASVLGFRLKEG